MNRWFDKFNTYEEAVENACHAPEEAVEPFCPFNSCCMCNFAYCEVCSVCEYGKKIFEESKK